ncbi:MAG: baseplate J/gp47 family protein [Candidatus Altarchaeum sp.]|nr:baseplate J/gp47 family protein [Candidatus Altarchaeum sp.]
MMEFKRKSYKEITEDILTQLTKGIIKEKHDFTTNRLKYALSNTPVKEIVKIEGKLKGANNTFRKDADYKLSSDMVEWVSAVNAPDTGTSFYVNYIFGEPSGITDVNPGSVTRTIVEAIASEIDFLYAQMNYVYLSGFIDSSTENALDLVVSLLGITRKPAEPASGYVVFGRNTPPSEMARSGETYLYDGKKYCGLKSYPVKEISKIKGTLNGESRTFAKGADYSLKDGMIIWTSDGKKPDINTVFYVDYLSYEQIKIPKGTKVSTYSREPKNVKVFETVKDEILKISPEGKWEADSEVKAVVSGKTGNVYAGTIIVMPQPPKGIEYVINKKDILNGAPAETDKELRNRAKHALEVAGKATLVSLKSSIEGIEGVRSVIVEDMPDDVPGIVRVIVSGGDDESIKNVIEDTRSVGIKVEFERPTVIDIDVKITVVLNKSVNSLLIEKDIESHVREYISLLNIGDDVMYCKIISLVLSIDGVYDISDFSINGIKENIKIKTGERAEARAIKILTVFK